MIRTASLFAMVASCLLAAHSSSIAADSSVPLAAQQREGQLRRVQVALEVNGQVRHQVEGKNRQSPIRVEGALDYHERLVRSGDALVALRRYNKSMAKMNIDGTSFEPTLRDTRRLIVAHPQALFSPQGTLRREELDMIDIQGSTLVLDQLLPGKMAKVGQKWKAKDATLAALLSLDKLTVNSALCKLDKVDSEIAHITIEGQVGGTVDGSLTEIAIQGTLGFNVEQRQVAWLVLNLDENRMAGPAGPGVKIAGKLRVTVSPLTTSEHVSDTVLADLSLTATAPLKLLRHDASHGRFRTWHDRRWHVVDDRKGTTVLRMIDGGQRIAQCNITASDPPEDKQQTMTLAKFHGEVQAALKKLDAEVTSTHEYKGRTDHRVFGVECKGKVSGVSIVWHYYHVINTKTRHRATLVVTLEQGRAATLNRTDLMLARSMQLLDAKKEVASKEVETKQQ